MTYTYDTVHIAIDPADPTTTHDRTALLSLNHALPVCAISDTSNEGGSYGTTAVGMNYPQTMKSQVTFVTNVGRKAFLMDDDFKTGKTATNRFVLLGIAQSTYSDKMVDVYLDSKENYIFLVPDMGSFMTDPTYMLDKGTHVRIDCKYVGGPNIQIGASAEHLGQVEPFKFGTWNNAKDIKTKTHLISSGNKATAVPANNSGIMINGSSYIEGNFNLPSQFISLGPVDQLFTGGCPLHLYRPYNVAEAEFRYVGVHTAKDILIPLSF